MISRSREETSQIARDFLSQLAPEASRATVIGLHGELGSGKTTFVQDLARALGVTDPITSPTFVLEKIYKLTGQKFAKLVHVDAYRLEKAEELAKLGFRDFLEDGGNLIVVEWAERVQATLGETKNIYFQFIDENTREISFA